MRTPRPFIPYFGAKWRAAKHYPAPQHATICEPFAGAAGYALNYCDRNVFLVDKYPVIVGVWRYLINVSESEFRNLPVVLHVDDAHGVPEEAKHLIGWWLQPAVASPRLQVSTRYKKRVAAGLNVSFFWGVEVRDALASQLCMIRHWRVSEGSYADIYEPHPGVTFYVDPPYQDQGRHYVHSHVDYNNLAQWCQSHRAAGSQMIVCEQKGADWLPFRYLRDLKNAGNRKDGKKYSSEVIWP